MPTEEPEDNKCAAQVKNYPDGWDNYDDDGNMIGYCANTAGFRTNHVGEGRCYLHGGCTPSGTSNAETHGLYTQRQSYYENRSKLEQRWMDAVEQSLLDDLPGSGEPSFAKLQMIRNISIDMHKTKRANEYIDDVGVVHKDKTVGYTDDGRPIKEDQENALNVAYDRLNKTITRQLKELGILDSPDKQQAEAEQNIADELSQLRKSRNAE